MLCMYGAEMPATMHQDCVFRLSGLLLPLKQVQIDHESLHNRSRLPHDSNRAEAAEKAYQLLEEDRGRHGIVSGREDLISGVVVLACI